MRAKLLGQVAKLGAAQQEVVGALHGAVTLQKEAQSLMKKLDAEEQEILDAFEAGTLKRSANVKAEIKRHQEYAATTLPKDSRINIRISSKDLGSLQKLALQEGLPYQTLIASLLHKYVEDRLVEQR